MRSNFSMLNLLPPTFTSPITTLNFTRDESVFSPSLHHHQNPSILVIFATTALQIGCYSFPCDSRTSITTTLLQKEKGCEASCSCVDSFNHLVVATTDGFTTYSVTGVVAQYPFEGTKKQIMTFKDCVVVGGFDENGQQTVTIVNLPGHFIEYSVTLYRNGKTEYIGFFMSQWSSLFVLSRTRTVFLLQEKDQQTKLKSLYEKHQYTIALSIAQCSGMDYNGILDIHRLYCCWECVMNRYGDYLYEQDENEKAIKE